MSKRLIIVFCAVLALAFAVPAFAAVQNVKVSGDIITRYIMRNDFDLTKGNGETGEDEVGVFNSVVRLRVDADLTDNVQTTIRLINERDWTDNDSTNTDIDLDLAYVTLKEFLYSPLTLTIGRQELHFGNDMIIGDGVGNPDADAVSGGIGTNQTTNYSETPGYNEGINGDLAYRKSFDAVRATLNYDPLVIDLVYAKIEKGNDDPEEDGVGGITGPRNNDDINLWGVNAGYKFEDKWGTFAEGYFWSKNNGALKYASADAADKADVVHTIGGRVSTNPNSKLHLEQELAYQFGKKLSPASEPEIVRDRSAWAAQSVIMVTPGWKHDPTMGLIYSYFSGDANRDSNTLSTAAGKTYHAWDPMFENQVNGSIINALFPQSNAHNLDFSLTLKPSFLEDITVKADYIYLLLAKRGTLTGTANMNDYDGDGYTFQANKKELGHEFDLNITYDYTEDVQFGLLTGLFWPGNALRKTGDDNAFRSTAAQAIASVAVKF